MPTWPVQTLGLASSGSTWSVVGSVPSPVEVMSPSLDPAVCGA